MKIKTAAYVAMALAVALATIDFDPSFARGGRGGGGGGMRGGGGASLGGGGARGGGIRSSGPTSIGSVGGARPRGVAGAIGNTGTGMGSGKLADAGNRPSLSGNRGNNNRINTGDVNINNGWGNGWGGYVDHPVAAGVVTGAVVGATAAAVGSTYYDVPAGCPPYTSGGYTYYSCGGAYYQPQYQGDTVVYTTVPAP